MSYGKIKFYLYSQGKVCSEKKGERTIGYDWEHLEVFMEKGEKMSRFYDERRGTGTLPVKQNQFEFSGYSRNGK